jgi:hypothetical protein
MHAELAAEAPGAARLLAVNDAALEDAAPRMAALGDIPLLQDTESADAWGLWGVTYRDVIIVDEEGRFVAAFNLTENDLGDADRYDALKALLLEARDR